jgi:hypothetical protein
MMETEAAREPEEGEARRRSLRMEEQRKKYSRWSSGNAKEGSSDPLHDAGAEAKGGATPKLARTTRL